MAVVVGAACLIVGGAVAGLAAPASAPRAGTAAADRASASGSPRSAVPPVVASRPPAAQLTITEPVRPMPDSLLCHDVDEHQCRRLVREALRVLPAEMPRVRAASAWRSLVCGDDFDCPSEYLRGSQPAGSVIVTFVDGSPRVAVNVVDWQYGPQIRLGLRGWLARSVPATD